MKSLVALVPTLLLLADASHAKSNTLRDVFFGETHLRASWSLDAYAFGNQVAGPEDAYRYARGEAVAHPGGFQVEIDQPLDFIGVTEHAEYMGVLMLADDPDSALRMKHPALAAALRLGVDASGVGTFLALSKTMTSERAIDALRAPDERSGTPAAVRSVTLSTPDLDATIAYLTAINGRGPEPIELHGAADEALWASRARRARAPSSATATCWSRSCSTSTPPAIASPTRGS